MEGKLILVSIYGPGGDKKEEGRSTFWDDLTECLEKFGKNDKIVLQEDMKT